MATTLSAPPEPQTEQSPAPRPARRTERAPRAPRERQPFRVNTAVVIASGLLLVTGLMALFELFLFLGSGLAQNRDQDVMYDDLKKQLALATVPVNGAIPTGTPIGINLEFKFRHRLKVHRVIFSFLG